jgi:hypothetical protein
MKIAFSKLLIFSVNRTSRKIRGAGQKASLADSIPTYDAWPKINAYALNE